MKKLFILTFLLFPLLATAQDSETPAQRFSVATNSFWSNWFVQTDVSVASFFGDRGNSVAPVSSALLEGFRTNTGFSVALGKWFTPGLGLRTRFNGVWGRTVVSENASENASEYWTLSEQLMFNFSNLFQGYSDTRRWNLIPYLSGSVGRSMTHNTYAMGLGVGVLNHWRLTPKFGVHLDVAWHAFEPDFDGAGGFLNGHGLGTKDQVVSLSLGLTYQLGRGTFEPAPDIDAVIMLYQSEIDALNAQLADEQAENERLRTIQNKP